MKTQLPIYPTVVFTAMNLFFAAMGMSREFMTISAAISFVSALVLLASIRRQSPQPKVESAGENQGDNQSVIQFVRNLQERGRFLDFVMADIHTLPDAQVGAVARVVHSGLKPMVQDYFSVEAISSEAEGSKIIIPQDEVGKSYRLLQSSSEQIPAKGVLVHKGWQARAIKLPSSQRIESDAEKRVLAFAEVDVKE